MKPCLLAEMLRADESTYRLPETHGCYELKCGPQLLWDREEGGSTSHHIMSKVVNCSAEQNKTGRRESSILLVCIQTATCHQEALVRGTNDSTLLFWISPVDSTHKIEHKTYKKPEVQDRLQFYFYLMLHLKRLLLS